ncbi:MAG: hypothetical protein Q7R95_05005 [bacterium]|nr:hypothetical protein [bacterium]
MMPNNPFNQMIVKIISEQENVIGPLAVEQAQKVNGLNVDWGNKEVTFSGDVKIITENLIKQYEKIFGQASIQICKEVASSFLDKLSKNEIPTILQ